MGVRLTKPSVSFLSEAARLGRGHVLGWREQASINGSFGNRVPWKASKKASKRGLVCHLVPRSPQEKLKCSTELVVCPDQRHPAASLSHVFQPTYFATVNEHFLCLRVFLFLLWF
jgi:hypothetical protein